MYFAQICWCKETLHFCKVIIQNTDTSLSPKLTWPEVITFSPTSNPSTTTQNCGCRRPIRFSRFISFHCLKQISFVLFTYSMSRKKRGYIYLLKIVPTVSGNGQNAENHERGYTCKHFRVPTLLSILQNAPRPKNTESGSFKQDTQLSQRAALRGLCITSTNLSKYGSIRCKSMCSSHPIVTTCSTKQAERALWRSSRSLL